MKKRFVKVVAVVVTLIAPSVTRAQSDADLAGYAGLILTPTGAFTPTNNVLGLPEARGALSLQARFSARNVAPLRSNTSNYGLGITTQHNSLATTFELGYVPYRTQLMGGVDMQLPLGVTPLGDGVGFEVGFNPAVGLARIYSGDGGHPLAMSAAISLPMALSFRVGQHGAFVPFVSPGFGVGRLSSGDVSSSGTRAMLGGGATFANADWPIRVTTSFRRIFFADSPAIFGFGLSLTP